MQGINRPVISDQLSPENEFVEKVNELFQSYAGKISVETLLGILARINYEMLKMTDDNQKKTQN